jgi:hypothetical protein
MYPNELKGRTRNRAAIALTILLYGQGLLGVAAVTAVLMKDRGGSTTPVIAASIAPAQPAS